VPRFSAHLGYLFTEMPLEDRFAAAAVAGFRAIEFLLPYGFGLQRFRDCVAEHGLSVAQIGAPNGDPEKSERGFACLPDRSDDFRRSVNAGIAAAGEIGCPRLHIMSGRLPDGNSRKSLRDVYMANLAWASEQCASAGLTMIIEPISDETMPGFYLNHPDFAVSVLEEIDQSSARMLFDIYHATVKGLDPISFLKQHLHLIDHIQIADHPGRHEPGTGTVPFSAIFDLLDEAEYDGWVGCEYVPAEGTHAGLGWLSEARRKMPDHSKQVI
jgi:hydroxypyruvate isomerase